MRLFKSDSDPQPLRLKITVIIEQDGNSFHAYSPGLKGLHVDGATVEETLNHAQDAIGLYLDSLVRHGDPLPVGPYCEVEAQEQEPFRVPPGAFLRYLEMQWPSRRTSGVR